MQNGKPALIEYLRRNAGFFLFWTIVAFLFRAFFLWKFRLLVDDTFIYGELAKNWLQHGIYGQTFDQGPEPTFIRMPGYPIFLILVWLVAGVEHYTAALIAQIVVDVGTCFVVMDLARRVTFLARESEEIGTSNIPPLRQKKARGWGTLLDMFSPPRVAFALTALCPFFANYAAVGLTETWAIFFAALAMDAAIAAFEKPERLLHWVLCGVALAAGILLRPDGGMLLVVVGVYGVWVVVKNPALAKDARTGHPNTRNSLVIGLVLVAAIAVAPLVPWTIRNWRTFHLFQPLTPVTATMPWEFVPHGFHRWTRTWIADYSSVEDVWFKVDGSELGVGDLPKRAIESESERLQTESLLAQYAANGNAMSPAIDAGFEQLAQKRIRAKRLRYYVGLPVMRAADLWLRPRTEMLPVDPHWWRLYEDDPKQFWWAVAWGAINLLYILMALVAVVRGRVQWLGFIVLFFVVRTVFLAWMPNPEPRYVLECYPALLAMAACVFTTKGTKERKV